MGNLGMVTLSCLWGKGIFEECREEIIGSGVLARKVLNI